MNIKEKVRKNKKLNPEETVKAAKEDAFERGISISQMKKMKIYDNDILEEKREEINEGLREKFLEVYSDSPNITEDSTLRRMRQVKTEVDLAREIMREEAGSVEAYRNQSYEIKREKAGFYPNEVARIRWGLDVTYGFKKKKDRIRKGKLYNDIPNFAPIKVYINAMPNLKPLVKPISKSREKVPKAVRKGVFRISN